ncbi:hypothetical protein EDD36DRAFT_476225 [Exophiala viscosa]|uniref:Uncharacterized protein n=1 Tax=Exophiala viscosa TaxID=2486360 RepID=A0AAN6DRS1_9EURO|nr:hypothetical protein EDD36DRAFT_476225 [Exophiala viscosa]
MAPVTLSTSYFNVPDLKYSSLELDARSSLPKAVKGTLLEKRSEVYSNIRRRDDATSIISPSDTFKALAAREASATQSFNPASGSIAPNEINMKGIQALIAIIGASLVLGAIWFFFWAKNGGFKWQKNDWDEYKSTVLRRKGPNGTTLSNATKSTILGGGSVVGDGYSDKDTATIPDTMTDLSSEAPIVKEKQSKKNKGVKETAKERKLREVHQAGWEGGHDNDVRAYRHEKPAKVGGLNTNSDAQFYGSNYSQTERSGSETNSNSNRQSSRQASPDKRQTRRDFSYGQEDTFRAPTSQPAGARPPRYHSPNKNSSPQRPIRTVPGSFTQPLDFDLQSQHTKSYTHHIPGLSGQAKAGGFRRDRRDSLDD